jgi:ABC-type nitrate/sulfonate/bicarbonate transport system substrate-binding protein
MSYFTPGRRRRALVRTSLRRGTISLAVALVATAALACKKEPREHLSIALARTPATGLVAIARAEKLFAAEGLDLAVVGVASGREALAAALDGRVDLAAAPGMSLFREVAARRSPRVLAGIQHSTWLAGVVARRDRGIARALDLRSRSVGYPPASTGEMFLRTLLMAEGMHWSDVRAEAMPIGELVSALASGRVDAAALWCPYLERAARALGPSRTVELHTEMFVDRTLLLAREEVVASRQPALLMALRALLRAGQLAREEPERAFAALRRAIPEDEAALRRQWAHVVPQVEISNSLLHSLYSQAGLLYDGGQASPSTFRKLLVPELLAAVDPEAVTLERAP